MALAYSAAGVGCEDDVPPPKRDASATGARDGSSDSATGGTGGTGGSPDAAADRAPDTMPDTPVMPDAAPDMPPDTQLPDTRPPDTLPPDTQAPDTQPPDTQLPDTQPPDTQLPDMQPPDTDPNAVTVITMCAQLVCPAFTDVTNACNADNQTCVVQAVSMDPPTRNICAANGVRKVSSDTANGVQLVVSRPGGLPCYTLDVDSPAGGPEVWIFKSPTNVTLATVTVAPGSAILQCPSNNTRWDITNAGCAGMEGEGDCTGGVCP
jgi:hypothetical protein